MAQVPDPLSRAKNLSDIASASTARTNLGVGTAGTLASDTDGTLAANSDSKVATQKAVKTYVDNNIGVQDAMVFKGVIDCSANPNYPAADRGHTYRVSVAGKIGGASGTNVEVGDLLVCLTDSTASGTQAAVGSSWTITQANLDGAVIGPSSTTDGALAAYNGTTGKVIKDLGITPSNDDILQRKSGAWTNRTIAQLVADLLGSGSLVGRNILNNGNLAIWQENTTYTPGGGVASFAADGWKIGSAGAGRTYSRQPGFNGAPYCLRSQRNVGNTATNIVRHSYQLSSAETISLRGKSVIMSLDMRCGADYTAGAITPVLRYGTGIDESFDILNSSFATGSASSGTLVTFTPTTTETRYKTTPFVVPLTASEMVIYFTWSPVGTAGADEYTEFTNIKLEVGTTATPFEADPMALMLTRARRSYQKSFLQATAPAQNAGVGTFAYRTAATKAAALVNTLGTVQLSPPMRTSPTVTLFNPAAANAQVRDVSASADCSSSAAQNIGDAGFEIIATGNASTAIGNTLGVHWVADARL